MDSDQYTTLSNLQRRWLRNFLSAGKSLGGVGDDVTFFQKIQGCSEPIEVQGLLWGQLYFSVNREGSRRNLRIY
jgi:hypothetical protein